MISCSDAPYWIDPEMLDIVFAIGELLQLTGSAQLRGMDPNRVWQQEMGLHYRSCCQFACVLTALHASGGLSAILHERHAERLCRC